MIKQISKITIILIIFLTTICSKVLAYSDELFKFDLPSSYVNTSYNDMYLFSDTENKNREMRIYIYEDSSLKKSVWDIEETDLNKFIRRYFGYSNIIKTDKKAKLGKEKAVNIILRAGNEYIDFYILASNKYIYIVTFEGTSQADLNNKDYKIIKSSFKLKDSTTNPIVIYILIAIAAFGIKYFIKYKKQNQYNLQEYNNEPDYKNMTEEDFRRMDE